MVELLKQGQFAPMDVVDQVMSIYAGTRGHLDDVRREVTVDGASRFLRTAAVIDAALEDARRALDAEG